MILPILLISTFGMDMYPYPKANDTLVTSSWENQGENILYEMQISTDPNFSNILIWHTPTYETYQDTVYPGDGIYCRRVKYYPDTNPNDYDYLVLGCFEVDTEEEDIEEDAKTPIPKNIDMRETVSKKEDTREVLGVSKEDTKKNVCTFSLLKKDRYLVESFDCDLGIKISSVLNTKYSNTHYLEVNGKYLENIYTDIKIYECERFNILKPNTWFRCNMILVDSFSKDISLSYVGYLNIQGKDLDVDNFIFNPTTFYLKNILSYDPYNMSSKVIFNIESQFKDNNNKWIDINLEKEIDVSIPKSIDMNWEDNPFVYPFSRNIGVTQWYGCTKYQCPHNGIDIGANRNVVLALGDGIVTKVGWDSYGGKCFQGGNYITIKHTNGMYSYYYHLSSYSVKANQKVKKRQSIGISGNTGKWNCQNLGYHLHLGLKEKDSTFTNPVKYIAIDWNNIKTIGKDMYPERLSGENPHPNF